MNRNKPREDTPPLPGAAYIRFSSEMQSDSFSLDAQLRQIKEQAERDGVEIVKVFSDPAQSAYRKKYRPGINAMREAARQRRIQDPVRPQSGSPGAPAGMVAGDRPRAAGPGYHLQSRPAALRPAHAGRQAAFPPGQFARANFISDNLSKETNKGKLERSLQGYHNGTVPWGYVCERIGNRKVGVPDPKKRQSWWRCSNATPPGCIRICRSPTWLNEQGFLTAKAGPSAKTRSGICSVIPTTSGKIRYRGMSVRPKGVSYRSTPPKFSEGKHEPIISAELWQRSQAVRASRRVDVKTKQKTARVHLLQSLAVCARCGRRLRIQTPKNCPHLLPGGFAPARLPRLPVFGPERSR